MRRRFNMRKGSLGVFLVGVGICAAAVAATTGASDRLAAQRTGNTAGKQRAALHVHAKISSQTANKLVDARLANLSGRIQVVARLSSTPVASSHGSTSKAQIKARQDAFIQRVRTLAPTARVIAQTQMVLNAVFFDVDAKQAAALARDTEVTRVVAVGNYKRSSMETVPYIGAKLVQDAGITGRGVRIAVLDSGIDYTHIDLGGPGTIKAYESAWAPIPAAGDPPIPASGNFDKPNKLFPNKKVVGGYDFVGEQWPDGDLLPDANPIAAPDASTSGGHGTHVASIIAGAQGVAPGAKLYAVKVCSAPTSSCSGVALLEGMDFAVDPNGDGDPSDHVDIINLSLGSDYGQAFDDDLSAAVDAASQLGVLTVAAAGNAGDKQFVVGTPGAADSAIAVAETQVPSAALYLMKILSGTPEEAGAVFQPWSAPLTKTYQGAVYYPPTNSDACNAFDANSLRGKIVLIDRGTCDFTLKISNLQAAGATLGVIGLITTEPPFSGALGSGDPITIPAFMINMEDADTVRGGATVNFSPNGKISLVGSVTSTSSRGPRFDDSTLKPDISAPGASVSSASGSGTGTTAFGGTSGATPMVSGSAALILQAYPTASPMDIKQALVNTADRNIGAPTVQGKLYPLPNAPVTRIGGGEVRVDRAITTSGVAFDADEGDSRRGGLSFGYVDVSQPVQVIHKRVVVESGSKKSLTYSVKSTFRFADDGANGAVSLRFSPNQVTLGPFGTRIIDVVLTIDGAKLRANQMNAGELGNAIGPLTANEYDGYIVLKAKDHEISLPWQVLPRKAARVIAPRQLKVDRKGNADVPLFNFGIGTAQNELYNLIAVSPPKPAGGRGQDAPQPDARAIGTHTVTVDAGVCGPEQSFVWEFAFSDWRRKATPVAISHEVYLDIDRDGVPDFEILNADQTLNDITDGRQLAWVIDLRPGENQFNATASYFAENATNTGVTVLRVCAEDVGLTFNDLVAARLVDATFTVADFYFGGGDDVLPKTYTIAPLGEEYIATSLNDIPAYSAAKLSVQKFDPYEGATPYLGLMLVTNGDRCTDGNCGGATSRTEAVLIPSRYLDWDNYDE